VVQQLARTLHNNTELKKHFVSSGSFEYVQTIEAKPSTPIRDAILEINSNYSEEIVRYYSPGYAERLIQNLGSDGIEQA
jgi:hypothetical protein